MRHRGASSSFSVAGRGAGEGENSRGLAACALRPTQAAAARGGSAYRLSAKFPFLLSRQRSPNGRFGGNAKLQFERGREPKGLK